MSDYVEQNKSICDFTNEGNWVILTPIEASIKSKIEKYGTPLKKWDVNIYRGVLTGFNDAFIIDEVTKQMLIASDPKSAEIIRPILRGRDIKRYSYDFQHLYLLNVHNGIKGRNIPPIDINLYPAVKKWLDQFYDKLKKRDDKGVTPYNLRNCAYMDEFSKQKILYPCIMHDGPHFMLDTQKEYFTPAPGNIITGNNLEYLLGFLCSKITYYVLRQFYMGGGIEGELKTNRLLLLPIPKYTGSTSDLIISRCSSSLSQENKNNISLFIDIENEVANHFNLTEEEKPSATSLNVASIE